MDPKVRSKFRVETEYPLNFDLNFGLLKFSVTQSRGQVFSFLECGLDYLIMTTGCLLVIFINPCFKQTNGD